VCPALRIPLDADRELAELKEYLGAEFDQDRFENYEETVRAELAEIGNEPEFYRRSRSYLYDLTVFAMSRTKVPYLEALTRLVPPGSRILDYGCGIGSDGLLLCELGYEVEFADFANPSTEYLRWRLARRGFERPIHDVDRQVPSGYAAAYSFDVLEHVSEPLDFLRDLEQRASLVMVNILEVDDHEHDLHHHLPVHSLLGYAAARDLRTYRIFHGSSHLVAYGPGSVGTLRRTLNARRVWWERLKAAI
jgi:plasmid stabilization system protein ParE